jgi:hypothetical protein
MALESARTSNPRCPLIEGATGARRRLLLALLLFMNLGDADLTNPLLGVDPLGLDDTFLHELLLGGYTRPLPEVLAELGPHAIYATLIPEWTGLFNARIDGAQALTGAQLRNGDVAYLAVPEPTTALLPAWGLVLLTGWRRR